MKNDKNNGVIPECNDQRQLYIPVGCGRCMECMKQKAHNWKVRLSEEIRTNNTGQFVTLTFSDESILDIQNKLYKKYNYEMLYEVNPNDIAKYAVRHFLEKWRKKHKKSVKHWLITELGHINTERIHLHGIIFTDKPEEIVNIWKYGWVYIGKWVNEITINYIVKYVTKQDVQHKQYRPEILTSPGIGKNYINRIDAQLNKYNGNDTNEAYTHKNGTKSALPTYYRNKIYSEEERSKLWTNRLNKNERYVMGEKIDVSTEQGLKIYFETRKFYRQKNIKLGYGFKNNNWDEEYIQKLKDLQNSIKNSNIVEQNKQGYDNTDLNTFINKEFD